MRTTRKLLPFLLLLCVPLLVTGYSKHAASSPQEQSFPNVFIVDVDPSSEFVNQVIEIDGKYRVEIRDESGDQRPDHWDLYIDGVLRCKRWSSLGYGLGRK